MKNALSKLGKWLDSPRGKAVNYATDWLLIVVLTISILTR